MCSSRRSITAHFVAAQAGMTGAEKALLVCFGLALVGLVGGLISRGSDRAASDAKGTLMAGMSKSGGGLDVIKPLQSAGDVAAPKGGGGEKGFSFVSADAPQPRPQPTPQPPVQLPPTEYSLQTNRSGGTVTDVSIQRLGVLPTNDATLAVLRVELGNDGINPATFHGIVPVWSRAQGGSASIDPRGNVTISANGRHITLFANGGARIYNPGNNSNQQIDSQGRLYNYAFFGRNGTTTFLRSGYEFSYDAGGQPNRVVANLGPHAGTWTRGNDGQWTNQAGRRWAGADGPGTWAQILGNRTRLSGIATAANDAIDTELNRVRQLWEVHFPPNETLGLTSLRTTVGLGFSGNIGTTQRLSGEITGIRTEMTALRELERRITASEDPTEIARLSRDFSRRALTLRDRIDRFRTDSARVLGQAARAGRAWAIAKDFYGVGTAGGPVTGLWNLGKLIKDVVGE